MKKRLVMRWMGGSGGDTLCYLLSADNEGVYTNTSHHGMSKNGKTLTWSKFDAEFPTLYKFSQNKHEINDVDNFERDIVNLSKKRIPFVVKHHFYNKEMDNRIKQYADLIDIGINYTMLPFVVRANLEKTSTLENLYSNDFTHLDTNLKKIMPKLDNDQRKKVVVWNLIKDIMNTINEFDLSKAPVQLENFFNNTYQLKSFFQSKGFHLNFDNDYFKLWLEKNKLLLPDDKYKRYIKDRNYQYSDTDIGIIERYVLLALANEKFQFLD